MVEWPSCEEVWQTSQKLRMSRKMGINEVRRSEQWKTLFYDPEQERGWQAAPQGLPVARGLPSLFSEEKGMETLVRRDRTMAHSLNTSQGKEPTKMHPFLKPDVGERLQQ